MKNIYVLLGSIGSLSLNAQNKSFALHSASNSEIYVNSDALVSVYGSLTVNDGKVQNMGDGNFVIPRAANSFVQRQWVTDLIDSTIKVPTQPANGNYKLISVNGVMQWVAN